MAALKAGSYVGQVSIDVDSPGNGSTFHWNPPANPFDLVRHPALAWQHTYKTSIDWMFISLAGPIAEAKLLRKPLRHLGSCSDYDTCMKLCLRLRDLAEFAGAYTDTNMIKIDALLDRERDRTKRWIGHPGTWRTIEAVAKALQTYGQLDGSLLALAVGSANSPRQLGLLDKRRPTKVLQRRINVQTRHVGLLTRWRRLK